MDREVLPGPMRPWRRPKPGGSTSPFRALPPGGRDPGFRVSIRSFGV